MQTGHSPLFLHLSGRTQRQAPRKLTQEEIGEIHYAFEKLAGESSTVQAHHLKIALRAMGFPVKKADVHQLMRDHSYSAQDALDLRAFQELLGAKVCERTPGEDLKRAFQLFDLTGSGRVTARDLALIAKQLKVDIEAEEINDMISEFDTDKDGSISQDDFRKIMEAYSTG
jgi:centrin-3